MIIAVITDAAATVAAFVNFFLILSLFYPIILQVIHLFDAQVDGELSLLVDDYVVVCQVLSPLLVQTTVYRLLFPAINLSF